MNRACCLRCLRIPSLGCQWQGGDHVNGCILTELGSFGRGCRRARGALGRSFRRRLRASSPVGVLCRCELPRSHFGSPPLRLTQDACQTCPVLLGYRGSPSGTARCTRNGSCSWRWACRRGWRWAPPSSALRGRRAESLAGARAQVAELLSSLLLLLRQINREVKGIVRQRSELALLVRQ